MRRFPNIKLKSKIIFLDIDGVLNHELHYTKRSQENRRNDVGDKICDLSATSITHLNNIIKETGADVVISSSWRKNNTSDALQSMFNQVGFKGTIIGRTPILSYKGYGGYPDPYVSVPRGCEIKVWIDTQYDYITSKSFNYLILDDDTDMLHWQMNNFIKIDSYCGLTPTNVYNGINILNQSHTKLKED